MNSWPEIVITSAGFLTLLIYHIHLVYKVKTAPMSISIGLTNHLRREWVQTIMEGMRGYYLSVPFTLWMFGPIWMTIGTAVLIMILYKLDRMA